MTPGPQRVTLLDGTALLVRPVVPQDAPALADAFAHWSADSRHLRFFGGLSILSPSALRYLTQVDHHDHEALVAVAEGTGEGVGIVRYVRDPDDARRAEMAVAVADAWHGRGVGTALLALLVDRARAEGVGWFTASVLAENGPMLDVLAEIGEPHLVRRGGGVLELEVALPPEGLGRQLPALLRHAARLPESPA